MIAGGLGFLINVLVEEGLFSGLNPIPKKR